MNRRVSVTKSYVSGTKLSSFFCTFRNYHDKQVMCRVENNLGMASGIRTIEVKCKYFLYNGSCHSGIG